MKRFSLLLIIILTTTLVKAQDLSFHNTSTSNYSSEEIIELIYKYDIEVNDIRKELEVESLPKTIIQSFLKSDYKDCTIAKILEIEPDQDQLRPTYLIFVENDSVISKLHFLWDGELITNDI